MGGVNCLVFVWRRGCWNEFRLREANDAFCGDAVGNGEVGVCEERCSFNFGLKKKRVVDNLK